MSIVQIQPAAQNYAWGKVGLESSCAQILKSDGVEVDPSKPYAEIWFGTHPSGPSIIKDSGKLLSEYILENTADNLGKAVLDQWQEKSNLPFLLKVLSIQKALSIQAHPDKKLAEQLFAQYPDMYKDDNHKPEFALALTDFEALCQFRAVSEIANHAENVPELKALLGESNVSTFVQQIASSEDSASALRELYSHLMKASDADVKTHAHNLVTRLEAIEIDARSDLEKLVLRVSGDFPGDVGVFSIYFLNYLQLKKGQGLFLAANEPHAYLFGDCIECMAASDNVVRAGLTPKAKHVSILCSMLTYTNGLPQIHEGTRVDGNRLVYAPPVPDFYLEQIRVASNEKYSLGACHTPKIVLVLSGSGHLIGSNGQKLSVSSGRSYFISANSGDITISNEDKTAEAADDEIVIFTASCLYSQ